MSDLDTENRGLGYVNSIIEGFTGNGGASTEMRQSLTNLVSYLNGKYGIQYLGGHKESYRSKKLSRKWRDENSGIFKK